MANVPDEIKIPMADMPTSLSISGTWVQTRDLLVATAGDVTSIESDADFRDAGRLISELTTASNDAEKHRKVLSQPFQAIAKKIIAVAKDARAPLEDEKARLQILAGAYADKKRAEQRAAEAAAREAVLAEAAKQEAEGKDVEDVEINLPAIPVASAPKSGFSRTQTTLKFEIVDESKLKREYLKPDESAIRRMLKAKAKVVGRAIDDGDGKQVVSNGIRFYRETKIISKG